MLIGETPGDREDLVGRPFVGPAGQLLDRALAAAGIDRAAVYVTNVVKHFKWEPRGKRRLHRRPVPGEIGACMPWLRMEIELVRPTIIVCLGATAGQALFGSRFSVTRERGRFLKSPEAPFVLATLHPSALLRIREADARRQAFERFVADLALVNDVPLERPSHDAARACGRVGGARRDAQPQREDALVGRLPAGARARRARDGGRVARRCAAGRQAQPRPGRRLRDARRRRRPRRL